jgi:probable HAF family extracellular repeat protein
VGTTRRARRALAAGGLALAVAQVATGCDPPAPPADGPVRLADGGATRSVAYVVNDAGQIVGTTDGLALWAGPTAQPATQGVDPELPGAMNERGDVVAAVAFAVPYRSVLVRDGVTTALDGKAVDIDEQGRVLLNSVGGTVEDPSTDTVVIWDQGRVTPVAVPRLLGGSHVGLDGFNDAGQVIGTATAWPDTHVSFVSQGGSYRTIGLPGETISLRDIDERGRVVGTHGFGAARRAFVWDGTMRDLAAVPGRPDTGAEMINEAGDIVGYAATSGAYDTVVWRDGVVTVVGSLGGGSTVATDLNERGDVVGTSSTAVFGQYRAFLWRDGVFSDLGPPGGASAAWDINDNGLIVGSVIDPAGDPHAATWQR